jgi:hypothetical protein
MKIDRKVITWYLQNIRAKNKELTDEELIDKLATWMETNPECINVDGVSHSGRYYYSTVGYGIVSLLGERYRMGRIEIFDKQNDSGYQIDEGSYCMPFVAANQFEQFIESIETDLPIHIGIGSVPECSNACAIDLGFENEDAMRDPINVKAYRVKKNNEYAVEQGYKDFEDLEANSIWTKNNKK